MKISSPGAGKPKISFAGKEARAGISTPQMSRNVLHHHPQATKSLPI